MLQLKLHADTSYYWNLTRYIYRYHHMPEVGATRDEHGLNEGLSGIFRHPLK